MPDYSGYAQRPQQDPNLAAWGQISGNLANIFGLDPAKAADARRGLQQEDYNAERNQAYIRQQMSNKRLGELFKKLNPQTGEFDDAADYQEYAGLVAGMEKNPNTAYGPGYGQMQVDRTIEREKRAIDTRATRDAAKAKADAVDDAAKKALGRSADAQKKYTSFQKTGHSKIGVSPDVGVDELWALMMRGGRGGSVVPYNQAGGFSVVTPETKGLPEDQQRRVMPKAFEDWLTASGYGRSDYPEPIRDKMRAESTNLQDEKRAVAAELIAKFTDPTTGKQMLSTDQIRILSERIVAAELTASYNQNKDKPDPNVRITGPQDLSKFLLAQAQLEPGKRAESVIYRVRVPGSLTNDYTYEEYNVSDLLDPNLRKNPKHPLFAQ